MGSLKEVPVKKMEDHVHSARPGFLGCLTELRESFE
jgi:hypothetical protein